MVTLTPLIDFFFLNDTLGWITEKSWGIYHTYDGGNTWIYEEIQRVTYQRDVRFIDETHS